MLSQPDEDYSDAIGRTEKREEMISVDRVSALAATLDVHPVPKKGEELPPGWHWLFFNPFVRRSAIGSDGHPKRGGFLPDVSLPRRMWAGGSLTYHKPLVVGDLAVKDSEIIDVAVKSGRAGKLVFVTLRHRLTQSGQLAIEEEQDIVYREAPDPKAPKPKLAPAPEEFEFASQFTPDPVLLFRYSALTSNGHRIHYDRDYAQNEEDYHDLVVHGPLTSTLLQGFAQTCRPDATLETFGFRGMAPLFVDRPFQLQARAGEVENSLEVWARGPVGELAMKATATFSRQGTT